MLSTTSQYALRALAYLASQGETASVLGRTISQEAEIPQNYLSKILLGLNNAGIVKAVRGTGGGYRLTKPAADIPLEQVVAVFDRDIASPCCLLGYERKCADANACSAHYVWKATRDTLLRFLRETSLADIASDRPADIHRRRGAKLMA